MPRWKHQLNIADAWKRAEVREITPAALARGIAAKLRCLPRQARSLEMAEQFEMFADIVGDEANGQEDWQDFDTNMEDLYDWADANRVWVDRF